MCMAPRFGSAVKCGDTGAALVAQPPCADPVNGGGELTGVDGLLL